MKCLLSSVLELLNLYLHSLGWCYLVTTKASSFQWGWKFPNLPYFALYHLLICSCLKCDTVAEILLNFQLKLHQVIIKNGLYTFLHLSFLTIVLSLQTMLLLIDNPTLYSFVWYLLLITNRHILTAEANNNILTPSGIYFVHVYKTQVLNACSQVTVLDLLVIFFIFLSVFETHIQSSCSFLQIPVS